MFSVQIDDSLLEKLRGMLDEEVEDYVRIREYRLGGGCRTRIILGLGIDEMNEGEDVEIDVRGVPFIADADLLLRYGREFAVSLEDGQMTVQALSPAED